VQSLRRSDAAGEVHEPVVVLLPEMPTAHTGPAWLNLPRGPTRSRGRPCLYADTPLLHGISRSLAGKEMSHDGTLG
jgi:hypothetical protein